MNARNESFCCLLFMTAVFTPDSLGSFCTVLCSLIFSCCVKSSRVDIAQGQWFGSSIEVVTFNSMTNSVIHKAQLQVKPKVYWAHEIKS